MKKDKTEFKPLYLTPVEAIPARTQNRGFRHDIAGALDNFLKMPCNMVKVDFSGEDFLNCYTCYLDLHKVCRVGGYPVKVVTRMGEVYLVKKDIK